MAIMQCRTVLPQHGHRSSRALPLSIHSNGLRVVTIRSRTEPLPPQIRMPIRLDAGQEVLQIRSDMGESLNSDASLAI